MLSSYIEYRYLLDINKLFASPLYRAPFYIPFEYAAGLCPYVCW